MIKITRARNTTTRSVAVTTVTALTAAFSALCVPGASAQIVYDSSTTPVLPAAPLVLRDTAEGPVVTVADDYTTILAGANQGPFFQLTSLSFFGGVEFTGPANGINNTLVFRFLNIDGAIPPGVVRREFQFAASGASLQTLQFTNAFIPTAGVIEVTTLPNSGAAGTFAFSSLPPTVGINSVPQGNGIRAFSLSGVAVSAPEPASAGLLLGAVALPLAAIVRRRRAR